jgi:hypothetical protein
MPNDMEEPWVRDLRDRAYEHGKARYSKRILAYLHRRLEIAAKYRSVAEREIIRSVIEDIENDRMEDQDGE